MSKYLGDYDASTVIYGKFTTYRPSTGAAFTLGGTPALSVYKDNSTTQSTSGVTLTADFDAVTGLNHFAIDTSADGTFYSAGSNFDVVITTGTVDSVSVVGSVVASFTIRKNSTLKPTTAGRTLDVTSTGEAGIDLANIGAPAAGAVPTLGIIDNGTAQAATSTTLQLRAAAAFASSELIGAVIVITGGTTGVGQARQITAYNGSTDTATVDAWTTTPTGTITYVIFASPPASATPPAVNVTQFNGVACTSAAGRPEVNTTHVAGTAQTAGDIIGDTNDIQARLPAALVGGRMDASVGAMAANTLTASALATDAVTEIQSGLATSAALSTVDGKVDVIDATADAILVDTAEIGVAGAGLTALASAASLAIVAGYLDTEVAAIKSVTDKVDPMLVLQSGGLYQFTENALALAPSGGSTPAEIADAVWDELLAGHAGAGSAGAALSAAGSAGDPWSTPLPGAYGVGTAGNIIGNNIDAAVSSRASAANLATVAGYIDTEVADIQARLPAALVGGRMDASVGAMAADVVTASAVAASAVTEIQSGLASQTSVDTLAGYVDTEVAAIKAQTDKLTFNASNAVKANITHVIDDAVQQNGSTTTNWGGTP